MKRVLDKDDLILRKYAQPVLDSEFGSKNLEQLVSDLYEVMRKKAAVGVAAPQIGIQKQVIVFSTAYTEKREPKKQVPDTTLINPAYKPLSTKTEQDYEGCLNCGDIRAKVNRYYELQYTGYDVNGELHKKKVEGLEARIVQHEVDHLNGLLFIDRLEENAELINETELQQRLRNV